MSILIRSSEGDVQSNLTTVEVDSPASITAGDLLFIELLVNDDSPAGAITPPAGWTEEYDLIDASVRTRTMGFTKTAVAADVTNQGTANYYDFTGFNATDDVAFCCMAIYDSVNSATPVFISAGRFEAADGGTTTPSASVTVLRNDTLVINSWSAHGGSDWFDIDAGNSITNGGQVDTKLNGAWVNDGFAGTKQVVYSHEVDIADSPFQPTLNHTDLAGGRGEQCISKLFEPDYARILQDFNAITTGDPNGVELTIAAGRGKRLLIMLCWDEESGVNTINPFTIGGQTYTGTFHLEHTTEDTQVWVFYWDEADLDLRANENVTFTDTQAISAWQYGIYDGVDQTTSIEEVATEIAENTSDTLVITSTSDANDYLLAIVARNSGNRDVTDWDTLTELGDVNPGTHLAASGTGIGGDASTTLTGDGIADDWLAGMYRINGTTAAGGGASIFPVFQPIIRHIMQGTPDV
jgi:hypothetical protein